MVSITSPHSLDPMFHMVRLLSVSLLGLKCAFALSHKCRQDTDAVAYVDPSLAGGSQIDNAFDGFGEPLNVNTFPSPYWFRRQSALMTAVS